ncbi:MAG: hypothetical protein B6I20_03805 [Bacteroidetes bacterium 4572_117]|nr:MAG: hypothetical protein B6I20_03805 [Bacteroidetes bacterium 4572_117]
MKLFIIQIGVISLLFSCNQQSSEQSNVDNPNLHKVVVQEVIQTSAYTYLLVKENDNENWLAVSKMQAEKGKTYYYENGLEMNNFHSKELNRNFETIFFLQRIETDPDALKTEPIVSNMHSSSNKLVTVKDKLQIEPIKNGITIAELFSNKEKYAGKTVKIKGQVTKYNAKIMKKNWLHIQDGTEFNGAYDLVATSNQKFEVGTVVTIEGVIVLNKDFGYGYFYEVIMEEALAK